MILVLEILHNTSENTDLMISWEGCRPCSLSAAKAQGTSTPRSRSNSLKTSPMKSEPKNDAPLSCGCHLAHSPLAIWRIILRKTTFNNHTLIFWDQILFFFHFWSCFIDAEFVPQRFKRTKLQRCWVQKVKWIATPEKSSDEMSSFRRNVIKLQYRLRQGVQLFNAMICLDCLNFVSWLSLLSALIYLNRLDQVSNLPLASR